MLPWPWVLWWWRGRPANDVEARRPFAQLAQPCFSSRHGCIVFRLEARHQLCGVVHEQLTLILSQGLAIPASS